MSCTRRTFLTTAASGLVLGARAASAAPQGASIQGANNRIRIGVIGTGGRARGLMTTLKRLPGNDLVAVCDVYEPRLLQAAEIAGATATKTADYRRILDDRQIDAVVIGTPDHWHKTIALDAVAAGKDVYVEKPVSHTIAEGAEMVKVIEASKQIVQTGTQQRTVAGGRGSDKGSSVHFGRPLMFAIVHWAEYYRDHLADLPWLRLPQFAGHGTHAWQAFVTYVDPENAPLSRNDIMERLQAQGIATRPGTHAVHMLGYYRDRFALRPEAYPGARDCNDHTMAIPLHNRMTQDDYAYVVRSLHDISS